jgi:hypothetical protein
MDTHHRDYMDTHRDYIGTTWTPIKGSRSRGQGSECLISIKGSECLILDQGVRVLDSLKTLKTDQGVRVLDSLKTLKTYDPLHDYHGMCLFFLLIKGSEYLIL